MALDPRDFPVQEHALANGLQVRLPPDRGLPIATLYSFFRVGSRNERPGITGISHLFEHMMFNGSKKYGPKEFDRRPEAAGGARKRPPPTRRPAPSSGLASRGATPGREPACRPA